MHTRVEDRAAINNKKRPKTLRGKEPTGRLERERGDTRVEVNFSDI